MQNIHVDASIAGLGLRGSSAPVCRDDAGLYLDSSSLVVEGVTGVAVLEAMHAGKHCLELRIRYSKIS